MSKTKVSAVVVNVIENTARNNIEKTTVIMKESKRKIIAETCIYFVMAVVAIVNNFYILQTIQDIQTVEEISNLNNFVETNDFYVSFSRVKTAGNAEYERDLYAVYGGLPFVDSETFNNLNFTTTYANTNVSFVLYPRTGKPDSLCDNVDSIKFCCEYYRTNDVGVCSGDPVFVNIKSSIIGIKRTVILHYRCRIAELIIVDILMGIYVFYRRYIQEKKQDILSRLLIYIPFLGVYVGSFFVAKNLYYTTLLQTYTELNLNYRETYIYNDSNFVKFGITFTKNPSWLFAAFERTSINVFGFAVGIIIFAVLNGFITLYYNFFDFKKNIQGDYCKLLRLWFFGIFVWPMAIPAIIFLNNMTDIFRPYLESTIERVLNMPGSISLNISFDLSISNLGERMNVLIGWNILNEMINVSIVFCLFCINIVEYVRTY